MLGKNARSPLDLLVEKLESPGDKSIAVCQWIENLNVSAEEHNVDTDKPRLSGKRLSRVQEAEMNSIKSRWKHVLSDKPGDTKLVVHVINTGTAQPVRSPPYMISPHKLEGVKK